MEREDGQEGPEETYPLGAVARLTGVSPERLRAWERRHQVVRPLRTPGGTRRYRASDLERLRLVKAATDAGHRIGDVAGLDLEALRRRAAPRPRAGASALEEILAAAGRLDAAELQRLLGFQLSALGAIRFAREVATPLLREIGERWARDELGIAAEHLASAVVRAQLGAALQQAPLPRLGPRIVFATPEGERHEIGLQIAALVALAAGAQPVYLGVELPVRECVEVVRRSRARALAVGVVTLDARRMARALRGLREALPAHVKLWVGGHAAASRKLPDGAELLRDFDALEHEVELLTLGERGAWSGRA